MSVPKTRKRGIASTPRARQITRLLSYEKANFSRYSYGKANFSYV